MLRSARAVCLACLAAALLLVSVARAERGPFAPEETPPRYKPDRQYDLEHVRLDLSFDWQAKSVRGTAANTLVPLVAGVDTLTFHAADLAVERVEVSGSALPFSLDPDQQTLTVRLGRAYGPADKLTVAVTYSAKPRSGLYFVGPDKGYPAKPRQIYSQGEPQLNRHWFHSWDYPNDRATTELLATVERPLEAVSNGKLVEVIERSDGKRTFHWSMEQPHTTYLVSIVVSEWVKVSDTWRGIPVDYYVPPGWEDKARRSFGQTPDILEFFSQATGHPYPYAKYAQTTVADFQWGGMENISATTQTLRTLHDERAALDFSSEGLVAHEAAHQWFGDFVTCDGWDHIWLNEGFAVYFTALYKGHARGEDELAWEIDGVKEGYLEEDKEEYRRPIVNRRYVDPIAMFDGHTYDKGGLVLHMLRGWVGEEGWKKGIASYLARHALTTVTTSDFQAAMEEATGVSLGELFDQYVYGAGHPELQARWEHDAATGLVRIEVQQKQTIAADTGYFSFPLEIALVADDGQVAYHRLSLRAKPIQDLVLASPARPKTVVLDPRGWALKTLDFKKPAAEWISQLQAIPHLAARLEAIRALGKLRGEEATAALGKALREEAFYGARLTAATALAEQGSDAALADLKGGLYDKDSRVRSEVLKGFGKFSAHSDLVALLAKSLASDESYAVRAAAAGALGEFSAASAEAAEAVPHLVKALAQESHNDVVRGAAIGALAKLEPERAYAEAVKLARWGSPAGSRDDAVKALATIGKDDAKRRSEIRKTLEGYLADPDYPVRMGAIDALSDLGDAEAIPALENVADNDDEARPRLRAIKAIEDLRDQAAAARPVQALEERIKQLEREIEVLKGQMAPVP
jgi:aminopeptidase N